MSELELLKLPKFVEPCQRAKYTMENHGSSRFLSLSTFRADKGKCVWCEAELTGRKQRWCGPECVASAQFHCHPQHPDHKMYRLIFEQNFACKGCGLSFEYKIRKLIQRRYDVYNYHRFHFTESELAHNPKQPVSLYQVGYGTGDQWQTDHIVPIHKGGKGIDPKNLQVLCVPCHKTKSVEER